MAPGKLWLNHSIRLHTMQGQRQGFKPPIARLKILKDNFTL